MDHKIFQFEPRMRQQADAGRRNVHGAAQGQADGAHNTALDFLGSGPDEKQNQQHQSEHQPIPPGTENLHRTILSVRFHRV